MDIPSWCRVGAKVVCVDSSRLGGFGDETYPVEGDIYTIRDVTCGPRGAACVRLEEVVNVPRSYRTGYLEARFRLSRFRPLVSQQDDIEAHFSRFLETGRDARITEGV